MENTCLWWRKDLCGTKGSDFLILTTKYWKYFPFLIHVKKRPSVITHSECHTSSRAVALKSFTPSEYSQFRQKLCPTPALVYLLTNSNWRKAWRSHWFYLTDFFLWADSLTQVCKTILMCMTNLEETHKSNTLNLLLPPSSSLILSKGES